MKLHRILFPALLVLLLFMPTAYSQDTSPPAIQVPDELVSPRATYDTLQTAIDRIDRGLSRGYDEAILTFDLSNIPEVIQTEYGKEIAEKLAGIMANATWPDSALFSEDPEGTAAQGVTTVIYANESGSIEITRGYDQAWRIGTNSVKAIVDIFYSMAMSEDFIMPALPSPDLPEGYPVELSSPRRCFQYLLSSISAVETASEDSNVEQDENPLVNEIDPSLALDLAAFAAEEKLSSAKDLLRKLGRILSAIPEIDPTVISNDLTGPPFAIYSDSDFKIEINIGSDGRWVLTRESVKAIPDVYIAMINAGRIDILGPGTVETAGGVADGLATPRRCYQTYYTAMIRANGGDSGALQEAIACLDVSKVPGAVHQEYSTQVANQLAKILDNIPRVDPESLSDDPMGPGMVLYSHESGNIEISQSADGAWRFSIATVKVVPEIYHGLEISGYFEQRLMSGEARFELSGGKDVNKFGLLGYIPPSWRHKTFLLEDWQWLFLILVILVGLIIDKLVPLLVGQLLRIWFRRSILRDKIGLIPGISRPFGFLAMSGFWWLSLGNSGLELNTLNVLLTAVKFMTAVGIVWCAIRAVDVVSEYVEKKAENTESRINDLLAPFARKSFKVIVTIFGIIFFASNFNINVTSLVAGLGLGGLAIALAAQDTLSNFFGSITVLLDRPFHVGDWVVIGGEIEGTVEELGFRSTRIRTFYNSVIIVPNSKLISTHVDNMGERQYRRIRETISIVYNTPPDKIDAFCEGIRELIRNHPYTRKDNYNVWLDDFSGGSLNILINCFLIAPDWSTEAREKHRLLLDIIRLAYELGVELGLPSQAIHMAKEKPQSAIFPEKGNIKKVVDSGMISADKKAKEIATSGLGGEGVKPPPFDFKNPTEFITGEEEEEL